jgi:formylmethanofuran dehydrogenase subunit D
MLITPSHHKVNKPKYKGADSEVPEEDEDDSNY